MNKKMKQSIGQIVSYLKKNRKNLLLLGGIILIGVFLRTYHFRQLLVVAPDQRRDLGIVRNVVANHAPWPLLGPNMTEGQGFQLGPMYYYFQISSAKIFGVGWPQQAYPDLFFAILSIPLLYYFLRKYFSRASALLAVFIYAVSYYAIEYSRFAWNVNLIPFFVLLFLVSLDKFLGQDEVTPWPWICLVGISLGVGVQLHAILLLLLPLVLIGVSLFLLFFKKKKIGWRLIAILGIALVLNLGQVISEFQTHLANTKDFQKAFMTKSTQVSFGKELVLDAACNVQANAHIISSLGGDKMCDFLYQDGLRDASPSTPLHLERNFWPLVGEIVSLAFSVVGLGFLLFHFKTEIDRRKKYFLGLILTYAILYWLIMLPVAPGSRMRYYLPIIFLPFVFLAFIFDYLLEKYPRARPWLIAAIILFLTSANAIAIFVHFKIEHLVR